MSDRRYKLGARLSTPEMLARLPQAADVLQLPAAPARYTAYLDSVADWILGQNDRYGDCACVCPANIILALTTLALVKRRLSDAQILAFYTLVSGFDPNDPSTDNGCVVLDVLLKWHTAGIAYGDGVDRIDGYANVDFRDHEKVRQIIAFIGPIDLGVNLPNGWMNAATWDVSTAGVGIAGGHCITAIGYTEAGPLIVSWGQVFTVTWAAWDQFVMEAHIVLSRDALLASGRNPANVDWTVLEQRMALLRAA